MCWSRISQIEEKQEFEQDLENTNVKKDSLITKGETNIPEIKDFASGKWAGFKFVELEIMRFYICLNQEDRFLEIIKKYWSENYGEWVNYPSKYLKATQGNRKASKNRVHLQWLKEIGYFKTESASKENKIKKNRFSSLKENERLFKINAGEGWQGKIGRRPSDTMTIRNPRLIKAAPEGWPDLAGWTSIVITEDMVGETIAVFTAEEIKGGKDRLSGIQKKFKALLIRMGAIYRELRDVD